MNLFFPIRQNKALCRGGIATLQRCKEVLPASPQGLVVHARQKIHRVSFHFKRDARLCEVRCAELHQKSKRGCRNSQEKRAAVHWEYISYIILTDIVILTRHPFCKLHDTRLFEHTTQNNQTKII